MQAASSPYLPPPQPFYQNIYHIQPLAPQDHELKRQYLTLLPLQQIIEICLTFDVHVPPYIKSTIWPPDISAAIANLRKTTANGDASAPAASQKDNDKPQEPVMASLDKPSEESSRDPEPSTSGTEAQPTEPQPSDKRPENPSTNTTTPQTLAPPALAPPSTAPAPPPAQQSPYPHQPYGYPQHPPTAYPHAPYYPPPPGYASYPPSSYPHYPSPMHNGYSHPPPPPPPHPGYPPPNPMYPSPHLPQPPAHQDQGSDDLPSYEEMIVEALQESTDPEGCAPKDLFAWMAARYPLQSNFRPSASQALQKAFKRGRFEKSSNGKYRLSATWEGGNTSRRTTRRPQTQSQSQSNTLAPSSASPFTHAPLIHHHHHHPSHAQQNAHSPYPGQPYPYPYSGSVPPGHPGYPSSQPQQPPQPPPQQQPQPTQAASSEATKTTTTTATDKQGPSVDPSSDVDRDAYEAAQNILKAINFGGLFQIAQGEGGDGKRPDDVSMDQLTSLLAQAQNAISQPPSAPVHATTAVQQALQPVAPLPTLSATAGVAVAVENTSVLQIPTTSVRAELQAQLALLAAQLAELAQENGEGVAQSDGQPQDAPPPVVVTPRPQEPPQEQQSLESVAPTSTIPESPVMDSLLPPGYSAQQLQPQQQSQPGLQLQPQSQSQSEPQSQPGLQLQPQSQSQSEPQSQPQPQPPHTHSSQPTQSQDGHQQEQHQPPEDIPIDPALQTTGVTTPMPRVTTQPTDSIHSPPVNPPMETSSTASPSGTLEAPPPPVFPASAPQSEPEPEPRVVTPNFVEGEDDSDDEDMEEII